jgi:cellulose 1,4-beta-cellobiosidase
MGLSVEYLCGDTTPMIKDMKPHLQVVNNGATAVPLSALTIRYYYTKDGSPATDQSFNCDYALLGCGVISATFNTTTGTNADEYLELSFSAAAGSLAPGASTGEIQARIHPTDYQYTFNQTNDYSFDPTKTAYAAWDHVTLFQSGTLVWGTVP